MLVMVLRTVQSMTNKPDKPFIHTLEEEARDWVKDGIITPEQRDAVLKRYEGIKIAEEAAGPGKLIAVVSVLGAILIGVGVLLFIASNWSRIPSVGKLTIIFCSMLASYGAGYYLRYERANYPRTGAALILLGSFIFGAGIFLIAQMYHIAVHYPSGPLLWGLFVLPLAYVLGLNALLSLAVIDLLLWLGMESTYSRMYFFSWSSAAFIALFLEAGLVLWALGLLHRGIKSLSHLAGSYLSVGLFLTFCAGYFLTFEFAPWNFGARGLLPYYAGFAMIMTLSLVLQAIMGDRGRHWIAETTFVAGFFLVVLLSSLLGMRGIETVMGQMAYESTRYNQGTGIPRLAFNLLYAIQVVGVIVLGYLRRNRAYVNLGLLFFVLDVLGRYFDIFYGLLPRALFFIGGGFLLLVGGILLEKKRRMVLASFNLEAD